MASKQANGANGLLAECYPSKSSGGSYGCFVAAFFIAVIVIIVVIVLL